MPFSLAVHEAALLAAIDHEDDAACERALHSIEQVDPAEYRRLMRTCAHAIRWEQEARQVACYANVPDAPPLPIRYAGTLDVA
jgi:hypothetical protein